MSRVHSELWHLPQRAGVPMAPAGRRAAVIGGGIAGVAAATLLCERGVQVTLLEREPTLGGRAGGFEHVLATGETVHMERGFHAFFRQYYNLRALLRRIDPELALLTALPDYPILGPSGMLQSFRDLPKRTPFQVLALAWRSPYLRLADLVHVNGRAAFEMLCFDGLRTYQRYDRRSAADYLDSLSFPSAARRMLFNVFSHSFFNPESELSAAELLMMFHFYFTGNAEGLVFDVVRRPLTTAIWQPFETWLRQRNASVLTSSEVERVERQPAGGLVVHHSRGTSEVDDVVLALDVAALQRVVTQSAAFGALHAQVEALGLTRPFAVWRLWLDRPLRADRAAFAGTTGVGLLDNISCYERFQDESAAWARQHGGSVVELHAYAVPHENEAAIKADLLAGLRMFYPETVAARVLHDCFLLRQDCPAFPPGSHAVRPTVATRLPNVALAGDFVAMPFPCALMERAAASGFLAANTLLAQYGVAAEPLRSVAARGLFSFPGHAHEPRAAL